MPGKQASCPQSFLWAPVSVKASLKVQKFNACWQQIRVVKERSGLIVVLGSCFGSRCFAIKIAEGGALLNDHLRR